MYLAYRQSSLTMKNLVSNKYILVVLFVTLSFNYDDEFNGPHCFTY